MAAISAKNKTSKQLATTGKTAAPAKFQARNNTPVAPLHEYLKRNDGFWPIRKIMLDESSKTYANIHPFALAGSVIFLLVSLLVYIGIALAIATSISGIVPAWLSLSAAIFLLLPWFLAVVIETILLLSSFRFSLQQEYLFVRAGAISPAYHMIPYENVQDTQVMQGVIQRALGIATVVVSTPANTVFIQDISLEEAQKFREDLLTLARMHKNMAE